MEIVCPKCKGTGKVYDHVFGLFTMGMGYLVQALDNSEKDKCQTCKGKGKLIL